MTKYYKCIFLSDVVLQSSSNTEGNVLLADFIAGSNFLGIVASNGGYESVKDKAFDIFHSGKVRFGDGHIVVENRLSYKTPLSYFNLKIELKDEVNHYNRVHLNDDEEKKLRYEQKQLKQIRTGFMNSEGVTVVPSYSYAQKSQHSKKYRRSEDEKMFGYSALKQGTEWIFKITFDDKRYVEEVEKLLLGNKRLGKSRSVEYGQVFVEPIDTLDEVRSFEDEHKTYLYFNSRVALLDAFGNPTLIPTAENLGLDNCTIDYGKSQIKNSSYNPYTYVRQTKDYTRVVLSKGSVIVIERKLTEDEISKLKQGVGVYLSEGFGDVLVNPKFLEDKEPRYKKIELLKCSISDGDKVDENLLKYLKAKEEDEEDRFSVALEVQNVYEKLLKPSKSQWGEIRSIASTTKEENLIEKLEEFIGSGVAKKQWEGIELISEIKKSNHKIAFTKLLAKICREHTKGGDSE